MWPMTQTRPQVLVAVGPGLLADLFRRSVADVADVTLSSNPHDNRRLWDVAVVSGRDRARGVRSRFTVMVASPVNRGCGCPPSGLSIVEGAPDYEMVVRTVRRLALAAVTHHGDELDDDVEAEASELAGDAQAAALRRCRLGR